MNTFEKTIQALYPNTGKNWLDTLPQRIADCEKRWNIRVLPPVADLSFNYIAPALRADGQRVILKMGLPNLELTSEIDALTLFDGYAAVKLLDADAAEGILLLEALEPGTPLATLTNDDRATRIAAQVMRQLWRPAPIKHNFKHISNWARGLQKLRHRFDGGTGPLPPKMVEKAESLFADLLASMGTPHLLHGDLHHWNILAAKRKAWLAIDPKGIIGEGAYETGAFLRNMPAHLQNHPAPQKITARRVAIFSEMLAVPRERILAWSFAQAILSAWWCIEDNLDCHAQAIQIAKWMEAIE